MLKRISIAVVTAAFCLSAPMQAQTTDLSIREDPTLYVVGTAHLDTQWRWTIQKTINDYIPSTLRDNFRLFEAHPDYVFSFEGAFRYQLMKEYYPEEYQRLKDYIAAGRWRVAGSWVDAVDTNIPSPESLIRQTLYGNGFFRREFGRTSRDVFLPDCFGFGYALPSAAAHCGLLGFSTQKLTWGSSVGVPFDIGMWQGVDGSALVAQLNPGAYVAQIRSNLAYDSTWIETITRQGRSSGLYAGYKYFGTGDIGGAPDSESVSWLEKAIRSEGAIRVLSVASDELAKRLNQNQKAKLPRYNGELLMTRHGVGCYTSQAAMKRWNRKNELLADAAERAAVMAEWVNAAPYPGLLLRDTWVRFLWHQFHDDLTGTSIPEAYQFSWNDELLCLNRFAGILQNAVAALSVNLDTQVEGVPVLVFNPLSVERRDVAEATVVFEKKAPENIRVYGPAGEEVPSQIMRRNADNLTVIFLAQVPPVGCAVYEIRPAKQPCRLETGLFVSSTALENNRYRVQLDSLGNVASIYDKAIGRELLSAPIRLQLLDDSPRNWPAWELDYDDIMAPPRALVGAPPTARILESGPVRVYLEITRRCGASEFIQGIRLAAGEAGNRVEFVNAVDWKEKASLLKAVFSVTSAADSVTYDLGLGTVRRGLNTLELYEVPAQQWADITSRHGDYGVSILNDCKYGWDHPDSATLRLSLIHTPAVAENWSWVGDQKSQDLGRHTFTFAVVGHSGDWRKGDIPIEAARLNQPLLTFQTPRHRGESGRQLSFLAVEAGDPEGRNPTAVIVKTLKKAEDSDEIVVRLQETAGVATADVVLHFVAPLLSARELNGAEEPMHPLDFSENTLRLDFKPYQPRTIAVRLSNSHIPAAKSTSLPLTLSYNLDGVSFDADRRDGDFDGCGNTIAGELLPDTLQLYGVKYAFGPKAPGAMNVVKCSGQVLTLPQNPFKQCNLLACAVGGTPVEGVFTFGEELVRKWIPDGGSFIGQWDSRLIAGELVEDPERIAPAYINRTPVAWTGTHHHNAAGENVAYESIHLFLIGLDIPSGAKSLTLPDDPRLRILAATLTDVPGGAVRPAQLLYDAAGFTLVDIYTQRRNFTDSTTVMITSPNPGAEIRYTLDGSDPTPDSPLYTTPLTFTETTTVKARAYAPEMDPRYVGRITVHRRIPIAARDLTAPSPGLLCFYYEGEWTKLPQFDSVSVKQKAIVPDAAIPDFARPERFGVVLQGYIRIPQEGMWRFFIKSDDGSRMYIADSLVVDNDGIHGEWEESGEIALQAGWHPIRIEMFQRLGGRLLEAFLEGPEMRKQKMPAGILYHAGLP
jgi:alpha-mannosidase